MRKTALSVACAIAALGFANAASAHSFICEKKVEGAATYEVTSYPVTLTFTFTVINDYAGWSTYTSVTDPTFPGFSFAPPAPYSMPVGGYVVHTQTLTLDSYEHCRRMADNDGSPDDLWMNTLTVGWDSGSQASCSASVSCLPELPPPPPPPPEGGATRTPGFYKTHPDALSACLAGGAVSLGFMNVESVATAMGLLWGSPAAFEDGQKRDALEKARFILGRHTLVASCNQRLFGTLPAPSDLVAQAVAALGGTHCSLMHSLATQVDAYNNSGDDEPFPLGFDPGPADPKFGSTFNDPTNPSPLQCSG